MRVSAPAPRRWLHFFLAYTALAAFFAVSAAIQLRRYPVGPVAAASIYLCLLLLLALFLAPGFVVSRAWLAVRLRGSGRAPACNGLFLLPYLIYAGGTGDFGWVAFAKLLVFSAVPFFLFAAAPVRHRRRLNWQDALALVWLAAPVLFRLIRGIWNVPVNLDFMARLFLVAVGAWAFLLWRGLEGAGYEFCFTLPIVRAALLNFGGFAVVAVPLGLTLRFIAWNPQWRGPWGFAFDYVTLFLFVAITEELFFRGLLQNLLEGSWDSRYAAQAAAAVLFGLSHIHHAPFPNWRYVILATIAGWFYGSAYRSTRSLMASATTHALVDAVWRTWFTLPRI
ncbi:MAG: CPBP family intramembrane metalloprotease [Acidobacteria bacterium]|nr:CPBP family intramembrane metalloprotease [Acidobacteriota bacterium]